PRTQAVGDPRGVGGWMLHVPPPHSPDVTVRAWPDTPPVGAAPIRQVVVAFTSRFRPVRHLVPGVPRGLQGLVGDQITISQDVVFWARQLATGDPGREPGA